MKEPLLTSEDTEEMEGFDLFSGNDLDDVHGLERRDDEMEREGYVVPPTEKDGQNVSLVEDEEDDVLDGNEPTGSFETEGYKEEDGDGVSVVGDEEEDVLDGNEPTGSFEIEGYVVSPKEKDGEGVSLVDDEDKSESDGIEPTGSFLSETVVTGPETGCFATQPAEQEDGLGDSATPPAEQDGSSALADSQDVCDTEDTVSSAEEEEENTECSACPASSHGDELGGSTAPHEEQESGPSVPFVDKDIVSDGTEPGGYFFATMLALLLEPSCSTAVPTDPDICIDDRGDSATPPAEKDGSSVLVDSQAQYMTGDEVSSSEEERNPERSVTPTNNHGDDLGESATPSAEQEGFSDEDEAEDSFSSDVEEYASSSRSLMEYKLELTRDFLDNICHPYHIANLQFVKELGKSKFGPVNLMRMKGTDKFVVDKVTDLEIPHVTLDCVRNEVEMMKTYGDHPQVIKFHLNCYDTETNRHHLLMEHFSGYPLSELPINELNRPNTKQILYQLCTGLQFLHSRGVMHRDIKPDNILVNSTCDVKILDFDLATIGPYATEYVGTPGYAAPEVAMHQINPEAPAYTYACDFYSVGATIYDLYYGIPIGFPERYEYYTVQELRENALEVSRFGFFKYPFPLEEPLMTFMKDLLQYKPECRPNDQNVMDHQYFTSEDPEEESEHEFVDCRTHPCHIDNLKFVKKLGDGKYGSVKLMKVRGAKTRVVDKVAELNIPDVPLDDIRNEVEMMETYGDHPQLIKLLLSCYDSERNELHLIMENFKGCTLADLPIRKFKRNKRKILYQLCTGLKFLHSKGIIHRDIKPDNLLVSKNYDLKIIDFDLATRGPYAIEPLGTAGHVAPEVAMHEITTDAPPYSYACDYYSVGALIYEIYYKKPVGYMSSDTSQIHEQEVRRFGAITYPFKLKEPFMTFMKDLLQYRPEDRLNDNNVLDHVFFKDVHRVVQEQT